LKQEYQRTNNACGGNDPDAMPPVDEITVAKAGLRERFGLLSAFRENLA
jgi:hypothetical protein